jgi:hypothetical protein
VITLFLVAAITSVSRNRRRLQAQVPLYYGVRDRSNSTIRGADKSAALGWPLRPTSFRALGAKSQSDFVGNKLPRDRSFSAVGEVAENYRVGRQR